MAIASQLMREGADIVGALNIVLAAQRIDADAFASKHPGRHREIRHREHCGTALAMLGHSKPVVNRGVWTLCEEPRGTPNLCCRNAGDFLGRFGRIAFFGSELAPPFKFVRLAASSDELLVDQSLGDNH